MQRTIDLSPQSLTNFKAVVKRPSVSDDDAAATAKIAINTQKIFILMFFLSIKKIKLFVILKMLLLVRKQPVNCD